VKDSGDHQNRIGCAYPLEVIKTIDVKGRDLISGFPRRLNKFGRIREAITEPVTLIVDAIKDALENARPNLRVISWIGVSFLPAVAHCFRISMSSSEKKPTAHNNC